MIFLISMTKRLFIAVKPSGEVREELEERKEEMKDSFPSRAIKWASKENLHITLAFLGNVYKDRIDLLKEDLGKIEASPFSLILNEITYIPSERRKAKMIWAKGESSDMVSLQKKIEKALADSHVVNFSPERKEFTPHITLGRMRSWEWQRLPLVKIPILEEGLEVSFSVSFFELMESKLKKEGPEYISIAKFYLK